MKFEHTWTFAGHNYWTFLEHNRDTLRAVRHNIITQNLSIIASPLWKGVEVLREEEKGREGGREGKGVWEKEGKKGWCLLLREAGGEGCRVEEGR